MVEESRGMVEESRGWYRYFHMKLQQQILFNMHIYLSGDTDIKKKYVHDQQKLEKCVKISLPTTPLYTSRR